MSCDTADATATGTLRVVAAKACWFFAELALWATAKRQVAGARARRVCIRCQFKLLFMLLTVEEPHARGPAQTVSKVVAESIDHLPSIAFH